MKRSKLLALVLVVAITLMGAGYAFWTETLAIDGTVKTGELDFRFAKASKFNSDNEYVSGTAKPNLDNDKILDIEFKNMHPGATAKVDICIVNTGTIGLKVKGFEVKQLDGVGWIPEELEIKHGGGYIGIREYFDTLNANLGEEGIFVDVKERECRTLEFKVRECATESDFKEEHTYGFSITADVLQYNDDGQCDEPVEAMQKGLKFDGKLYLFDYPVGNGEEDDEDENQRAIKLYSIRGNVYKVYNDGSEEILESGINVPIERLNGEATRKFGDFKILFKTPSKLTDRPKFTWKSIAITQ